MECTQIKSFIRVGKCNFYEVFAGFSVAVNLSVWRIIQSCVKQECGIISVGVCAFDLYTYFIFDAAVSAFDGQECIVVFYEFS